MANVVTDEAGKARVIAHMNKDHQTDLSHILQHFNGLSAADAADARMLNISLDSITVASNSGTHVVKVEPPMKWEERRQRLIDITLAARAALGVVSTDGAEGYSSAAHAAFREYLPPQGFDRVVFGAVAFFFAMYSLVSAGQVEPGTALWTALERLRFPYGPQGFKALVRLLFFPTLAIHLTELWWLDRSRLQKHGIVRGSKVWWLWISTCFFDGISSFVRFDKAANKLAKSH